MEAARSFTDLIVWRKSHEFVLAVYQVTSQFPKTETYGLERIRIWSGAFRCVKKRPTGAFYLHGIVGCDLVSQFRRAAVSIPANIAEGFRKRTLRDKSNFLNIAEGSLEECRYYLILAHDLSYMNNEILLVRIEEVARLLSSYRRAIESKIQR